MQQTLKNTITFQGVGLHTGEDVTMTIEPAGPNAGLCFVRKDIHDQDNLIPALWDHVEASQLCTLLKNKSGVTISTVEHIMAALSGCGVDNATIHIDGPEAPIMDGSSLPFIEKIQNVGLVSSVEERKVIQILKTVQVQGDDGATAMFEPADESIYEFTIDFTNPFIGRQHMEFALNDDQAFGRELADSPTFTTKDVIDHLQSLGLIKGGSIDNADVYTDEEVLRNPSRPRQPNAAVRHKLLDAVGDCYLLGCPFIGRYVSEKGGHALTNKLLRALMADDTAYTIIPDPLGIGHSDYQAPDAQSKIVNNG